MPVTSCLHKVTPLSIMVLCRAIEPARVFKIQIHRFIWLSLKFDGMERGWKKAKEALRHKDRKVGLGDIWTSVGSSAQIATSVTTSACSIFTTSSTNFWSPMMLTALFYSSQYLRCPLDSHNPNVRRIYTGRSSHRIFAGACQGPVVANGCRRSGIILMKYWRWVRRLRGGMSIL